MLANLHPHEEALKKSVVLARHSLSTVGNQQHLLGDVAGFQALDHVGAFKESSNMDLTDTPISSGTYSHDIPNTIRKITIVEKNDVNIICSNRKSLNINILDECIDVYGCNSIYMTYNSKSKVKNIHRMLRSMEIDKENPKKIAKIILWCDKIYDILTHMDFMKEIDNDYMSKIKYLGFSRNFYEIKNLKNL